MLEKRLFSIFAASALVSVSFFANAVTVDNVEEAGKETWTSLIPFTGGSFNRTGWSYVDYRGSKVDVVDMHLHTGTWADLPESFQEQLLENIPSPFNIPLLAEPFSNILLSAYGTAAQLICSRISRGVLFAVYAPDTIGLATNKFVYEEIQKVPKKFYGLASLPVDNWDTNEAKALNMLRKYLALPEFIGVKMAHPHMKINLNDARFYSIYEVAREFGKPVYVHTGLALTPESLDTPEATHPAFFEEAIQLFPDVNFILGHIGNKADFEGLEDPFVACFRLAQQYTNVYLEASALGSTSNYPDGAKLSGVYREAKERMLVHRMIYGSDGPQFPGYIQSYLQRTLAALDRADYAVEEAELVLEINFNILFGVW